MVIRRHLVSASTADSCRARHVVVNILMNSGGRGCRPGLLGAPVLSATTRCPSAPVLLPRRFECGRGRLFVLLHRPRGALHARRPWPLTTWLQALAIFGRFIVLVLRKSAYLGGPKGLVKVGQPTVGFVAALAWQVRATSKNFTVTASVTRTSILSVTVVHDFFVNDGREPVDGLLLVIEKKKQYFFYYWNTRINTQNQRQNDILYYDGNSVEADQTGCYKVLGRKYW